MSSLTSEWLLKTKDNCIKYIIDIDNFDKKIKNYRIGREIHSKKFKISSSTFQISIYPSGENNENRNHVAVFLRNKSPWRVKAGATFSVQNTNVSFSLRQSYFQRGDEGYDSDASWGYNQFVPHKRCVRDNCLSGDNHGTFTLQVDVELVEEEVPIYRDLIKTDTMTKLENLEDMLNNQKVKIEDQKVLIGDQNRRIGNLQLKVDNLQVSNKIELLEIKNMIKGLTTSPRLTVAQPSKLPQLECPICLEVVRKPMRLKQCGQGHTICDFCHDRAVTEAIAQCERDGNSNLGLCHACRSPITGRPFTLESVLGLN